MAVGPDTYVSDLLTRAGGVNAFDDPSERYPSFELEDLKTRSPTRVLLSDEPYPFDASHQRALEAELTSSVSLVSGDDCCWHGVRSIRGVRLATSLFGG